MRFTFSLMWIKMKCLTVNASFTLAYLLKGIIFQSQQRIMGGVCINHS